MSKKIISLCLALLIIFSQFGSFATVTFGEEIENNDFIIQDNILLGLSDKKKEEVMSSHSLVLPEGILEIGAHALQGLGLESITFNSDLQKLNEYALTDNKLITVSFPDSLMGISDFALRDNELTSLDTNKVSKIGVGAFQNNKIKSAQIRSDVSSIDDEAFRGNNLSEINIPDNVLLFGNRVFTDNNRYVRILGSNPIVATEKVDGHYGHICNAAIVTVKFLDKETENEIIEPKIIGNDFNVDGGLILEKYKESEYVLPKISGYTPVNEKLVLKPDTDNSEAVAYYISTNTPPSFKLMEKRFKIGSIIDSKALINGIKAYDFQGKDISDKITVTPENLDSDVVGTFSVTYSVTDDFGNIGFQEAEVKIFSDFENYEIGNGWVVGDFTFEGNQVTGLSTRGKRKVKTNKNLVVPNINLEGADVTIVGSAAFRRNSLESVKILEGITVVNSGAFDNNSIDTLLLPDSIEKIQGAAFRNNKLVSFNVKKLPKFGSYPFSGNAIKPVIIYSELDGVNIKKSGIICNPVDVSISTSEDDSVVWDEDDFIWDGDKIIRFSDNGIDKIKLTNKLVIPEKASIIGQYAFADLKLTNVVLNEGLEVIEKDAFYGNSIKEIDIPESVITIENFAFSLNYLNNPTIAHRKHFGANYYDLKVGLLYNPIKSSGDSDDIFEEEDFTWIGTTITGLTEKGVTKLSKTSKLVIPEKATVIGKSAFRDIGITSVVLPDGLKRIEENAFEKNKITSLAIPDSVEFIGNKAFLNNELNNITLGVSLKEIGKASFANNKIENLIFPFSLSIISSEAFKDNNIKNVDFGENIKIIGKSAFENNQLENIYIPDSISEIGEKAFLNNALKELNLGKGVLSIGELSFQGNKIEALKLNENLKSIGKNAFSDNLIKRLIIPDSLLELGEEAFKNNKIKNLSIGKGLKTINIGAFMNNEIEELRFPDNVSDVNQQAFYNNHIKSVIFGKFIEDISADAFSYNHIEAVNITKNVRFVDKHAFSNNKNDSDHPSQVFVYIRDEKGKLFDKSKDENAQNLKFWFFNTNNQDSTLINPIIVNINYIDEDGKALLQKKKEILVNGSSYSEKDIEYIDGYILPKPVTIDISTGETEYDIDIVYKKADKNYKDMLSNNAKMLGVKHETEKKEYQIGDRMISFLNFNVDASVDKLEKCKIKLFFNSEYYDYNSINIPNTPEVLDFKKSENVVELSISQLYAGKVVRIPISWEFKRLVTPSNTEHTIQAYVINEKNEIIANFNDVYFKGTYLAPNATARLCVNNWTPPLRYGNYIFSVKNSKESGLPDTYVISYFFNLNLYRKSKGYKLECKLPEYVNNKGETMRAVFSEENNPNWKLSKDGETVIYNNVDTCYEFNVYESSSTEVVSTVHLNLNYPGLKEKNAVKLDAKITAFPYNKPETEPPMAADTSVSFFMKIM